MIAIEKWVCYPQLREGGKPHCGGEAMWRGSGVSHEKAGEGQNLWARGSLCCLWEGTGEVEQTGWDGLVWIISVGSGDWCPPLADPGWRIVECESPVKVGWGSGGRLWIGRLIFGKASLQVSCLLFPGIGWPGRDSLSRIYQQGPKCQNIKIQNMKIKDLVNTRENRLG